MMAGVLQIMGVANGGGRLPALGAQTVYVFMRLAW